MTDVSPAWERALVQAHHDEVPPALHRRVRAQFAKKDRRLRIAAAALGVLLLNHAGGNLLFPAWIADAIHGHYDGHLYREAGVAILGVGVLMILAALRTRLLDAATAVGAPVGLGFGAIGVWELQHSLFGASVHLGEGAAAVVLLYFWWQARYARPRRHEGEA